jgi:hypothetical protein
VTPDTLASRVKAFRRGFKARLAAEQPEPPEGVCRATFEVGALTADAVIAARGIDAAKQVVLHRVPPCDLCGKRPERPRKICTRCTRLFCQACAGVSDKDYETGRTQARCSECSPKPITEEATKG